MSKSDLRIDWATHEAAKYACENWHYSGCIPKSKLVKVGAWENGKFIGVVIFGMGATPNLCKPYGLNMDQACELVRIALSAHKSEVSKIMSIAIKFLKKSNPGLKLIVSYADKDQGHTGAIYQATNWIYQGLVNSGLRSAFVVNGKKMHPRTVGLKGGTQSLSWVKKNLDPNAYEHFTSGKHKYLMPLDAEMRDKILHLSKPYPKRTKRQEPENHSGLGGSTPTRALHRSASETGDGSDQEHGGGATPTRTLQTSSAHD